jgi:hypothetical protein
VSGVRLAASLPLQRRTWIRMLACVSFSANSTPNIPGLSMLVQILRTRTLNVYFGAIDACPNTPDPNIECLGIFLAAVQIFRTTKTSIHFSLMQYSLRIRQIFVVVALNIYTVRPWEGDARHRHPPRRRRGRKGVPPPGLGFGFKVGVGVRGSPCRLPPSPTMDLE